ncbi:phenylacetate--CoA ligase family protein [Acidobacteriota bacterium]
MFNNLKAMYQVRHDAKLPRSKLEKVIHRRLKTVLVSAYQYVSYYRELMQSVGYDPVIDYRGREDLVFFPITTKEIIKQRGIKAFVKKGGNLTNSFSDTTSGSTGIPLRIYRTSHERTIQIAKWLRFLFINGYNIRDKVMSLSSPWRHIENKNFIQKIGFLRRLAVDYSLPPEEIVDIFLAYEPDVLYGNRTHLDLMAQELKRRGIRPKGLKILIGTADIIHDRTRRFYRKNFGVELIESYGSVEMGIMAQETPFHDGLHLCEDLTYFEFLDKDGTPVLPGMPGRVVVTDLFGKLMPFIRYDQGDLATVEQESGFDTDFRRKIRQIIGREDDIGLLPDGTRFYYHEFDMVLSKYEEISQFRILQQTRNLFKIFIVADTSYILDIHDDIISQLKRRFPPVAKFEIVQVERITPDLSGKLRMFISELEK